MNFPLFPAINTPFRAIQTGRRYIWPNLKCWVSWIFTSRADANFTYAITDGCKINLAASVASILNVPYSEVADYFAEIENDESFKHHLARLWESHPERYRTDDNQSIGRRMVWYAIARIRKPKLIVETGVDQGLGATVLCAALMRNSTQGHPGRYYGTDINPKAGFYLQEPFSKHGEILYGDSIESLRKLEGPIDLFINDSDHSAEYEAAEYEVVKRKLSQSAIILGDNSHVTSKLAEFSVREGRKFVFLSEEPKDHWYRGAGVGISV
ncbi:class I SAM-dependent methyltransferase [Bradyrhizobium sp. ISRA443]|uniref:class I SAM-dependent methyltransferase n=1 Tax=unclassified Bradyrhizobium TaxID=2631580 RepID=UPI002478CF3D|nr:MULTISPECIES: class I SAM-dependent methyltransferase [unclassified Bradyrhizobium]WGR92954.1 class I SAM-dependent methyltransferase [Bradyrhizobium sp. ISRA435]WGR97449.1 class I SAM-dependent methyltransferase [Bradyrhizobium sp. ISRA436]WGS04337.1 class I SAM-dependent methyltransferase [Bradyrhizobium sp. ISRA437]WGS11221.1 class I SAM-dependent methyltransferase [Bradyrhizobium sp. ISRA443]